MSPTDPLTQNQLGLLLESTGEGIFGIDLEGHCTFINRAGAQMLGYEVSEVLGNNMHTLTHHSHPDGSRYADSDCPIFNAFRLGLACRIDTEVFWKQDCTPIEVEYSSHPIMDGATVVGAVIAFVDITQRNRTAQALQKARLELEERVADRNRELQATLEQLRELTEYAEQVRENERARIAREDHDGLASLTAEALAATAARTSPKSGAQTLSTREQQVFELLTLGCSVSEIGAKLQLASNTVSTYRMRILEKTGTKNDVELALFAERKGLRRPNL